MPGPLRFHRRWTTSLLLLLLILPFAMALPFAAWFWFALSPLQKQYFPTYFTATVTGSVGLSEPVWWIWKTAPKRKPMLAHEPDVVPATHPGHPVLSLALSPAAKAGGWTGLVPLKQMLRPDDIYRRHRA